MDPTQKTALTKCNLYIKKNLTNIDRILDILLKEGCLLWDERIQFGSEKSSDDKCQNLLEILVRRGGICYKTFLDSLKTTGNEHIAKEIEDALSFRKGDDKQMSESDTDDEKDKTITDLRVRIDELTLELEDKNDKLKLLRDQQRRALDDLRKQREKNSEKDLTIKSLERKNHDLEKEINKLKITIENIQKQLRRVEEEKKKTANEQLRAIQNLERKQDATQKTCEKLCENFTAFARDFSKNFPLQAEVKVPNQKAQAIKDIQDEVQKPSPPKKFNNRQRRRGLATCNFSDAADWRTTRTPR
ncbi:uncharacterized protein LOC127732925 [Mytilus californianus]|uniref:uncharacterized protein LOC127732925 n=1 Tax=Mytilus californianus TaxID=6549 RepID=UPI0022467D43|nr:uncharacterized protein LOC127732925 [Mytilus californianus]